MNAIESWMKDAYMIREEKLSDKELKAYEDGFLHGLEYALKLVRYNREKFGDMDVNKAWIEAHREIRISIEASIERIKNGENKDSSSSVT
jgi:hypothetical protein